MLSMCCESWGALSRCCAACWKNAPSLLQLQLCCPLHLLRFGCWCPIACVNCCCCAAAAAAAAAWWSKLYCTSASVPLPWRRTSARAASSPTVWNARFLEYRQQVVNTTRSRSVACVQIVMSTTSECGVLVRCVIKPCCTFESLTLHHCASPPTQRIVLLRVRVLLTRAPTPSTRPTTPLLPPPCALPHVAVTAVSLPPPRALAPDAAVTVLRLSHSAAAGLFLLTHLLPVYSADCAASAARPFRS